MKKVFRYPSSTQILKREYRKQCAIFRYTPVRTTPMYPGALSRPMKGLYFSILQSLLLQLSTPTIRKCITWRTLQDVRSPYSNTEMDRYNVYPYFFIIKKCIDGYSLKGNRSLILSTLTNASIWSAEHSVENTDVHYLMDHDEDRYLRNTTDQMSTKEMFTLQQVGVPDLDSGYLVNILPTECEDSKSMQLAVGRGGPMSRSRLIFTKFRWFIPASKWETVFSPISFSSFGAHYRWCEFMEQRLRPKCVADFPGLKPELVPFAKTLGCEEINQDRENYLKAYDWLMDNVKYAGLQCGDWHSGQSIHSKMVEPLHCLIRVSITVMKWYIIYVIQYCEWIGDPTNQHFRNLNHVDCPDYEPPTLRQIKKHFCECCDIPLHYDHESPSTAKIAGEASWRKRLWGHLEDVVSCSNPNCEFRPWAGSPLEKYFLVMFVDLMEVMIPLDILDHQLFDQYWNRYLAPKNIRSLMDSMPYEKASVWNIYAQHFFTLFMCLLGENRMTRYIHGMVFCTNYGMDIARALQSTYRALFGSDVVERMNSLTKTVLHTASSKFGGRNPEDIDNIDETIGQIMRWTHWDRYRFRETSPTMNLKYRLKKFLRKKQLESDIDKMNGPNRMRRRCRQKKLSLDLPCPVSNHYQKNRRFAKVKKHTDDIYFYSSNEDDDDDAMFSDPWTADMRTELRQRLMGFDVEYDRPIHDEMKTRDENWNVDDDDDDKFDFDESKLIRRFYKLDCIAFAECDSGSTELDYSRHCQESHPFCVEWSDQTDDMRINWNPLQCILKESDFNFGARWIRLTTAKEIENDPNLSNQSRKRRNKKDMILYRLTWKYELLRYITYWNNEDHIGIWIKVVDVPRVEEKKPGSGWDDITVMPPFLNRIPSNGKIGIFVSKRHHEVPDVENLVSKYKYFTPAHQITHKKYIELDPGFSDEEKTAAMNAFRGSKCPLVGLHKGIALRIDGIMQKHRTGFKRLCLSCQKFFGVFERHVICLQDTENNENVTRHVYDRLQYENYTDRASLVRMLVDPAKCSLRNRARDILRSNPDVWGMVLVNVYTQFVYYLQTKMRSQFMNCRKDSDYEKLNCSVLRLLLMLNRAMEQTLRQHEGKLKLGNTRDVVIQKLIRVVSNMFILPMKIWKVLKSVRHARKWPVERRRKVWKSKYFRVRLKNHYRNQDVCPPHIFITILFSFNDEFAESGNLWTFWEKLNEE